MCNLLKTKQIVQTSACLERESTTFVAHPSLCCERVSRVGVVFAYGSRFGGHAIYLKDGKMHYIYTWLGDLKQQVVSNTAVPTGVSTLSAIFTKEGENPPHIANGTQAIYINE
jgi:hypothetical protein